MSCGSTSVISKFCTRMTEPFPSGTTPPLCHVPSIVAPLLLTTRAWKVPDTVSHSMATCECDTRLGSRATALRSRSGVKVAVCRPTTLDALRSSSITVCDAKPTRCAYCVSCGTCSRNHASLPSTYSDSAVAGFCAASVCAGAGCGAAGCAWALVLPPVAVTVADEGGGDAAAAVRRCRRGSWCWRLCAAACAALRVLDGAFTT